MIGDGACWLVLNLGGELSIVGKPPMPIFVDQPFFPERQTLLLVF